MNFYLKHTTHRRTVHNTSALDICVFTIIREHLCSLRDPVLHWMTRHLLIAEGLWGLTLILEITSRLTRVGLTLILLVGETGLNLTRLVLASLEVLSMLKLHLQRSGHVYGVHILRGRVLALQRQSCVGATLSVLGDAGRSFAPAPLV